MKTQYKTVIEAQGYALVLGYLGILIILIGVITLLPLFGLLAYPQESPLAVCFILPGVGAIILGYLLYFPIRGKEKGRLSHHQDAVIVVLCWICAILITALPFVISQDYSMIQAVFETTSGWSTTGLSVVDVEASSHLILLHRTIILFFGGVGLVLVMCSVLSDSYGMRLYSAEGHSDRLLPNLMKSARMILSIYLAYILAGILLYVLCGMPLFDAFIHSVGALSTGGFSSHAESIGYYHDARIEWITIVLMLLGNINFYAHLFLVRGKWKRFFHYCEIRCSLFLLAFCVPFLLVLFMQTFSLSFSQGMRIAIFQAVSALTTTGFQTVPDFTMLSPAILSLLILLQLIGGGSGSTAGGMKQIRIYVMWKGCIMHLKERWNYRSVVSTCKIAKVDHDVFLNKEELSASGIYIFLYFLLFCIGTFALTLYGYPLQESMFEFSSALSTVGLSAGIMNATAPSSVLLIGIFGMFFGRLEIFVILIAFAKLQDDLKIAWKKQTISTILKRKKRGSL